MVTSCDPMHASRLTNANRLLQNMLSIIWMAKMSASVHVIEQWLLQAKTEVSLV